MLDIGPAVSTILDRRAALEPRLALLVGVSGIDGSGKGYVTGQLVAALRERGQNAVGINLDTWLVLPKDRFRPDRPAEHFYENSIRFAELFENLVRPLRATRSVDLVVDGAGPDNADAFRPFSYRFADVDIVLLEGVFLFKQAYRPEFDLAVWVDCTFETALERALQRGQEGLPAAETVRDYETIYFPAQRLHAARDRPRESADLVIPNDPRLAASPSV